MVGDGCSCGKLIKGSWRLKLVSCTPGWRLLKNREVERRTIFGASATFLSVFPGCVLWLFLRCWYLGCRIWSSFYFLWFIGWPNILCIWTLICFLKKLVICFKKKGYSPWLSGFLLQLSFGDSNAPDVYGYELLARPEPNGFSSNLVAMKLCA